MLLSSNGIPYQPLWNGKGIRMLCEAGFDALDFSMFSLGNANDRLIQKETHILKTLKDGK